MEWSLNVLYRGQLSLWTQYKRLCMVVLARLKHWHICLLWDPICSVVWTLHSSKNIELIESVQCRAAQWIKSSFDPLMLQWTKSSRESMRELGWPSLELWCNYVCIVLLYAILNNLTPINFSIMINLMTSQLIPILWRIIWYPPLLIVINIPFLWTPYFFATQFLLMLCQLRAMIIFKEFLFWL